MLMADKYVAYVGSYTRGDSKGISIFDVHEKSITFELKDVFEIHNPSFLRLSYDKKYLYSTCDEGVAAFKILKDGSLVLLNKASVKGLRPCYLSTDSKNKFLVCGGYHDGKLTVMRIDEDGSIGGVTDEVFMKGLGSIAGRNYRCHVNCALFTPDEKYLLAVDLGMDQVKIYQFDHKTGMIKLHDILRCELESGPKHMIFSHDGKYAYMTHENKNYITQYAYSSKSAQFTKLQVISTLPDKYDGFSSAITLKISADDRYLFATNSGNNSVAVYEIQQDTKVMECLCILPISGDYPRDILLMPDGENIVCVNQESDTLTCFTAQYDKRYIVMNGKPVDIYSPTSIQLKKLE